MLLTGRDGLFLHISDYNGAFLAVISEEPNLEDGHHVVLDIEVVETRNQATDWFLRERNNLRRV